MCFMFHHPNETAPNVREKERERKRDIYREIVTMMKNN